MRPLVSLISRGFSVLPSSGGADQFCGWESGISVAIVHPITAATPPTTEFANKPPARMPIATMKATGSD